MSNLHLLNNKSQKNNSKGFYIALGVCLIAVGVAAWTTYDSVVNYAAPDEGTTSSAQAQHTNETVSGIKVIAGETSSTAEPAQSEPAKEEPSQAPSAPPSSAVPAKQTTASVLTFTSPVEKTVALKFSGENPVFSTTMKDWRVHNGTDFSAKTGTAVKAIADGTVKNVYTDDLYGVTAVILHGSYETYYCGLDAVSVKKGAAVKQGQQIGTVGTIPCESADAAHLHLSMKKAGKYVDPLSVIK
ncbi:M23 family metallopeptidase [Caproiciproducens faecalis]|uniref:Peptidoglycan DD-metalloendopeptidase family protein n=1 Tax=Caproiciproducens faecalis TaxID=2820301 RepID=A0ABS7DIS7_9FIRM|nr:M23 family metallopeptidase [Caproiciproducens faecalis]MBW7571188.1 peptidoglycan DD-metalloendopeptidase family protein [Caproiciproducens faecalis]